MNKNNKTTKYLFINLFYFFKPGGDDDEENDEEDLDDDVDDGEEDGGDDGGDDDGDGKSCLQSLYALTFDTLKR